MNGKAKLIVLEDIRVASPCSESWDGMRGDDRVRHCERCDLDVFNLSGMTREAATDLVRARNGNVCGRFFKRRDGTVLTADCPVGIARVRRRAMLAAAAVLSFLGLTSIAAFAAGKAALGQGGGTSGNDALGSSTTVQALLAMFSAKPLPTPEMEMVMGLMIAPSTPTPPSVPNTPNGHAGGSTP